MMDKMFIGDTTMKRFLISGSSKFNNYYLFRKYVSEYFPAEGIIVTCGGDAGTDAMSREYSNREKIPIEEYPLQNKDADSVNRRNSQILSYCQSALIFDDGRPGTVAHLKTALLSSNKSVIIVEINTEIDNIDYYKDCTDAYLADQFNAYKRSEYDMSALADIVMAVLSNTDTLSRLLSIGDDAFIKSDKPNVAAGFAYWLRHNEVSAIKRMLPQHDEKQTKTSWVSPEERELIWSSKDHPVPVFTVCDLPILEDFNEVVVEGKGVWLEAVDGQIIMQNLWQTREQLVADRDNPVNSYYETKDNSNTKVFFRNTEFEGSPFKTGYWYFETSTLR